MSLLAALPGSALTRLRGDPGTRAAALEELARRVAEHGPTATRPAVLSLALGIPERTLREVLIELDAAGLAVVVGWVRRRGGGGVAARKAPRGAPEGTAGDHEAASTNERNDSPGGVAPPDEARSITTP